MAGWLKALNKEPTGETENKAHAPQRTWSAQVFEDIEWRRSRRYARRCSGRPAYARRASLTGPTGASISSSIRRTARSR